MRRVLFVTLISILPAVCFAQTEKLLEEGVSWELAQNRKTAITSLHYSLEFSIPENKDEDIEANEEVSFTINEPMDVILDFNESADKIHSVGYHKGGNGKETKCKWKFVNGHIVIPKKYTYAGKNTIKIDFTAGNQGLNRRDGYVYTLFVPDRAHTVFPCFDQPNMKAVFNLTLDVPNAWSVAQNGYKLIYIDDSGLKKHNKNRPVSKEGYRKQHFEINTPIPTYLFAFAAGEFKYQRYEEDGMKIGAYYRETDSARIAQLPEIMHQVVFSMKWQEEFTGVTYPFPKYDLVILPGFQFGGMEHVGATFYNDNTIFLPSNPTPDEQLRRTELIAHETSHMWFGDAVTMNWFDDVWTKEVFANYFAAEITAPLFPGLNHELNWLKTYVNAAISQDRTEGRTSIRQPLSNMRYAGLVYNNIIYNKAPVMMRKMVDAMGKEAYRRGIQKYVKKYKYGNATWDDLITMLDAETSVDLKSFSREWVDEAHWPHYTVSSVCDPRLGREYGYCELTNEQCDSLLHGDGFDWLENEDGTGRQAILMTLNENYLNGKIDDVQWMDFLETTLKSETDPLTTLTLVGYMSEPIQHTFNHKERFDVSLLKMSGSHSLPSVRTQLLRLLANKAQTPEVIDRLYDIWYERNNPLLSINDYMTLAYELAIRMPDRAKDILSTQRSRIDNPDRLAQFDFISRSVSPSEAERDSLFSSLAIAENRRIEPWTLSVLYYLNHPLRQQSAIKYIRPALDMLPEIQRTGDIFFPANWCNNLLAGHRSPEAYKEVERFLADNEDMLPLLRNKILSAMYYLKRSNTENIKNRIK